MKDKTIEGKKKKGKKEKPSKMKKKPSAKAPKPKKEKKEKKKASTNDDDDDSGSDSGSDKEPTVRTCVDDESDNRSQSSIMSLSMIPQSSRIPDRKNLPGAIKKTEIDRTYWARILEEERPDLCAGGKLNLAADEAELMDKYMRDKGELISKDAIYIKDNQMEDEERKFQRYQIQFKYNEGRYSAIYVVQKQSLKDGKRTDEGALWMLKTGLRRNSATYAPRIVRDIQTIEKLNRAKAPFVTTLVDTGRVCGSPYMVTTLLDMNLEKVREYIGGRFLPASAAFIGKEVLSAITTMHRMALIHRDIKPANICIGLNQPMKIYIIDYGDTVKPGTKMKWGVSDMYTLPYWSLDAHCKNIARGRSDVEAWFYVFVDMLLPAGLTWKEMTSDSDVEAEKKKFWAETATKLADQAPSVLSMADLINSRATDGLKKDDYPTIRAQVKELFEQTKGAKYSPEWARPNTPAGGAGGRKPQNNTKSVMTK